MSNWYLKLKTVEAGKVQDIAKNVGLGLVGLGLGANPTEATPPNHQPQQATQEIATDAHTTFVARVIFSEGAGASSQERLDIASVMKNRIGNRAFGKTSSMYEVANNKSQFSCIGDRNNHNWALSEHPDQMNMTERRVWQECLELASGHFEGVKGPSGRPIVYYHDNSISRPANWTNKYFTAVEEINTGRLTFYSIVPTKK